MSDLDETKLRAWLESSIPGFAGLAALEKFPGGQSNPTYRITTPGRSYVLRRKPFGALLPSAHAVEREYRLLTALHPTGFPVPQPIALCEDRDVIGASFYVMELVEGRSFWNGALPETSASERRPLYHAMVDTLAQLHEFDPEALGLGDFGRPGNYFARQVERWTKQYHASQTDDLADIDRLIDWLPATVPVQTRTSIIHGDYRIDNIIYAASEPRVAAILDWELATIGDPLADFAYFAMSWVMPADGRASLGGIDLAGAGIPTLEEMAARYCSATKRENLPDLHWYFAFNLFRLASILQGVKKRARDGNASSAEAVAMGERVPLLAQAAWRQALLAGAQ